MTPDQQDTLAKATESALRLKRFADKAQALGLNVLASHIRDASIACQYGADMQQRSFQDNLLSQTGKVVIDKESRGPVQTDASEGKAVAVTSSPASEVEALADAIHRKGLIK